MSRAWTEALSWLCPQRAVCHACGAPLSAADGLVCPDCRRWLEADTLTAGRWETMLGDELACAASAFRYDGTAAALVKALKFQSDQTAALALAHGMAAVYAALPALRAAEVCVPVPVHRRRLRSRGYNQAAVLAGALSQHTGLPVWDGALLRLWQKRSQIGSGRAAREANIAGAFVPAVSWERRLRNRSVLLVDDVLTTGATAQACAHALLSAGARSVALLTACRA